MNRQGMTIREEVETRDMWMRSMSVRANTLNPEARTVEAVFATEEPTTAFDLARFEPVNEVLLMDGFTRSGDQVPLLDSHPQKRFVDLSTEDIRGAGRNLRVQGTELHGTLHFDSDEPSDRLWTKVSNGFVTDVSVGILPLSSVRIDPGDTQIINGRSFMAQPDRPLYVRTKWTCQEISATVIGADPNAKIREQSPQSTECVMNEELRNYLNSIGLTAGATIRQAWEFFVGLEGDQATQAQTLRQDSDQFPNDLTPPTQPPQNPPAPTGGDTPPDAATIRQQVRAEILGELTTALGGTPNNGGTTPAPNEDTIRQEERQRIQTIRDAFGGDLANNVDLFETAIRESYTVERVQRELLTRFREGRTQPVAQGPGIHTRSAEQDRTIETLGAALMIRESVPLDHDAFSSPAAHRGALATAAPWLVRSVNDDRRQQVMDQAHQFVNMSLVDICRAAVRIDGQAGIQVPNGAGGFIPARSVNLDDRDAVVRAAVSGSALSGIFSTNINAQILVGYQESGDTTMGWVAEEDVSDFKSNERYTMGKTGPLQKLARGGKADHTDLDDSSESYKIARYAKQWVVDEMDIIDDRFGGVDGDVPRDMGLAARQLRPDLVYAALLANPSLNADSTAVFHANHGNIDTNAFSEANLETGITKMGKQRIRNRPINVRPRYLLVPMDLDFSADKALTSGERRTDQTGGITGTKNPLQSRGITVVSDDRLGAGGVTDPDTGTSYTGSATRWHLMARPGEGGAKTLVVGYRRGTGRAPVVSSGGLTQGQWGLYWDINFDIGTKWLDYRGAYQGNG